MNNRCSCWLLAIFWNFAFLFQAEGNLDGGGQLVSQAGVNHQGSLGGLAGISSAAPVNVKSGFVAQLTEPLELSISAQPATVNEGASRQLEVLLKLDDETFLEIGEPVSWDTVSGPIAVISAMGVVTAGDVYEDTAATVKAELRSLEGMLDLVVLETVADNFGSYAGDGLEDDWQVFYFGIDHPEAGPQFDPDQDRQTNEFESVTGLDPTDPASFFSFQVGPVVGQSEQTQIEFGPLVAGRNYTVQSTSTLIPSTWVTVTPESQSDNGTTRSVVDDQESKAKQFYRVQISRD